VAGRLADDLGAVLLRSDRVRKELAGLDPRRSAAAPFGTGLYASEVTSHTYDALLEHATVLLAAGETVVLDATWSTVDARENARRAAAGVCSRAVELRCTAPPDVVADRVAARPGTGDPSDADGEVARRLAAAYAPWPEAVPIDTCEPLETTARAAVRAVRPVLAHR
jgi:predicted kinase